MTLKTILKNFLNYADTLEAQKKLGKDLYEIDFQKLKALTEQLKHDKDYSTSEGLKEVNRRKNRYKDILPYDYTRVILSEYPGVPGSDFINANYIKGASGSLAYIASQGPLPNTVVDFWRMIWECEVQVIVMACNEQESGKYKCECYWPTDDEKKQYGNINIEFVKWRQVCPDFLVRTLKACWENEERVICQFHYTTWPDHGVPNSVQPILELVRLIRDCQASEAVPVLIHCSAGCGRTGTICAIDYVWGLMRMGKLSKNFNLFNVIADMRRQRIAMVQTKEQYVLVHKAVSSLFEQQLRVIDSHTYENLDEDGEPLILRELQEEDIYEDILEPLSYEENVNQGEKSGEWKIQPSKMFHDCGTVNMENVPIRASGDSYSILPNSTASASHKTEVSSTGNFTSGSSRSNVEKIQLEQHDLDVEFDSSCSRNSKILMKLCREESVKHLISGWNRAVEKSDDPKSGIKDANEKDSGTDIKSPTPIYLPSDQKSFRPEDFDLKEKNFYSANNCKVDNILKHNEHSLLHEKDFTPIDSSPKNNLLEDNYHAGKLIGKATVIRRPSIAKLKALFEKSSQESHESERQRRPLFRSHSHHVSNSSRTFTVSDTVDQQINSNTLSTTTDQSSHLSSVSSSTNEHNISSNSNEQNLLLPTFWNQNISSSGQRSSQRHSNQSIEGSIHKQKYSDHSNETSTRTDNFEYEEHKLHCPKRNNLLSKSNDNNNQSSAHYIGLNIAPDKNEEIHKHRDNSLLDETHCQNPCASQNIPDSVKLKHMLTLSHNKEKAPELPAKRKPAVPTSHMLKNKSNYVSKVNTSKGNHSSQEKSNKLDQGEVSGMKKTEKLIKTFFKTASGNPKHNVVSQSLSSPLDYAGREGRRNSHETVRNVHGTIYKNQSFSDPEQGEGRSNELSKQNDKQNLIHSETSTPQSNRFNSNLESSAHQDDCTYTNVNDIAEKNIQQIEDKIKSHPRGAIIDLTSRKSYIDEMSGSGRKHMFHNTIQPVKFSPALESQDLTSYNYKNRKKGESQGKETLESCTNLPVPKSSVSKPEKSAKDSELIDSKNLLLHSPPPKSKRSHSSKAKSTPPLSSSSSNEVLDCKSTEVANHTPSSTPSSSLNSRVVQSASNSCSTMSSGAAAADRSDPRYFPVTRQTASEAKYECEKQKATSSRDSYNVPRPISSYEPLYSTKQSSYAYHKATANKFSSENYGKKSPNLPVQNAKYLQESTVQNIDNEPIYGLQRSASGPQIIPGDHEQSQTTSPGSEISKMHTSYQLSDDVTSKQHTSVESAKPHYVKNPLFGLYGTVGMPNPYPVGPPKPPRTFHYDSKSNAEDQFKTERNIKRDSGRYFVPVASPKHSTSNPSQHAMIENQNTEYRYGDRRQPEQPLDNNPTRQGYGVSPQSEVPMSRSYPFSHYDSIYGHPRPYGKQFHPDSIQFRNVQVTPYANNSIYGTVKEKPPSNQQCLYGTIKHRNAFSEYESVYDSQMGYKQSNSGIKQDNQDIYQSINSSAMTGHQRSHSEANNAYSIVRSAKSPVYLPHNPACDFNYNANNVLSSPRKVYFDTLQRRHKQRVTWEQRRSHDDMDIQSAQSSRLREQIHARRSMVELDNLEISVASDEGFPEKGFSSLSPQAPLLINERSSDASQKKKSPSYNVEFHKDSQLKKNSAHYKDTGSFGETLSKAFGKLTSLTKFNSKDAQSNHNSAEGGNNGQKAVPPVKQKEKEKSNTNVNQSPNKSREPGAHSEQWTQV